MSPSGVASPRVVILSTGSEITEGVYADTNAMELSRLLTPEGFRVVAHAAVPDDAVAIRRAIDRAMGDADLVVVTGGLGPTEDDLTREVVAEAAGVGLRHVARAEAMIRALFAARGRAMPDRNRKQAFIPEGSVCLLNFWGTAPGFFLPSTPGRAAVAAFPGVPHEWRAMMERYLPRVILPAFAGRPVIEKRWLHLCGMPESEVNALLAGFFGRDGDAELGLLAQTGIVRVRLRVRGAERAATAARADALIAEIRAALPAERVFSQADRLVSLEEELVGAFRAAGRRLVVAESCTGGGIAKRITDVAGASDVLLAGWVTYSNEAKRALLGVGETILTSDGAVSEACARAMASGARERSGADVAVSVTGIAGPGGGTPDKPVGLVWFAVADARGVVAHRYRFEGDRPTIRRRAENEGLDLLRGWLARNP